MNIQDFINNIKEACDELEDANLTPETKFRDLDEWSSLCALSLISMVDEEYDQELSGADLRSANTIRELFDIVESRS